MGSAFSTTKMPPNSFRGRKQERLSTFARRWERKLGVQVVTDKMQQPEISATDLPKADERPSPAARLDKIRWQSARAATKLKKKVSSVSDRLRKTASTSSRSVMDVAPPQRHACTSQVGSLFQDICPRYLEDISAGLNFDTAAVVNYIADEQEAGRLYPKRTSGVGKRKRDDDEEGEDEELEVMARVKRRFDTADRRAVKKTDKHLNFMYVCAPLMTECTSQGILSRLLGESLAPLKLMNPTSIDHC